MAWRYCGSGCTHIRTCPRRRLTHHATLKRKVHAASALAMLRPAGVNGGARLGACRVAPCRGGHRQHQMQHGVKSRAVALAIRCALMGMNEQQATLTNTYDIADQSKAWGLG